MLCISSSEYMCTEHNKLAVSRHFSILCLWWMINGDASKIYFMQKLLKSDNFISFASFFLISHIISSLMPSDFLSCHLLFWEDIRSSRSTVKYFSLLKVTNIKSVISMRLKIFDLKVKPLQMSSCITINSHKQIILILSYL